MAVCPKWPTSTFSKVAPKASQASTTILKLQVRVARAMSRAGIDLPIAATNWRPTGFESRASSSDFPIASRSRLRVLMSISTNRGQLPDARRQFAVAANAHAGVTTDALPHVFPLNSLTADHATIPASVPLEVAMACLHPNFSANLRSNSRTFSPSETKLRDSARSMYLLAASPTSSLPKGILYLPLIIVSPASLSSSCISPA